MKTVIEMAREAGGDWDSISLTDKEFLTRFAELVAADEQKKWEGQTVEPAKWHPPECEGECIACLIERLAQEAYGIQGLSYLQRHLTSSPAQRKPLTDEQREQIYQEWASKPFDEVSYDDLMLAVEAAHGIKGDA